MHVDREQHAGAEGTEDPELKQMLGARGGQAAVLTQELSVLCREIEETSRAALASIGAQFADPAAAPAGAVAALAAAAAGAQTTEATAAEEAAKEDDAAAATAQQ